MATPKKIVKRAARKTASAAGYNKAQTKAYARSAVKAVRPAGVTADSKTVRKQIAGSMTAGQRRKVRKYDRTG